MCLNIFLSCFFCLATVQQYKTNIYSRQNLNLHFVSFSCVNRDQGLSMSTIGSSFQYVVDFLFVIAVTFRSFANTVFTKQPQNPSLGFCFLVENVTVQNDGKLLLHQHVNFEETNCVSLCPLHCSATPPCLFN